MQQRQPPPPPSGECGAATGVASAVQAASLYSTAVDAQTEEALVRAAAAGDGDAFAVLVRQHEGRVRATCARIVGDSASAEDCAQDAFAQAWKSLGRFDGRALFGTWLYRIAANEALQSLRRRRSQEVLYDEPPFSAASQSPGPAIDGLERARVRAIVRERLLELPDVLRIPVVLRDVEEWSNDEIATALGISLPAAKARIHRGRMRLRELLTIDFPERA